MRQAGHRLFEELMPGMLLQSRWEPACRCLQMTFQPRDLESFCAVLPTSLRVLHHKQGGIVLLPDLGHLTALTELRFDKTVLTGGALPHMPAFCLLVQQGYSLSQPHR